MGKLVVSEFASLDGVMEDPGKWSFGFPQSETQMKFKTDELFASDALLTGRATYEGFALPWPSMQDDPVGYGKRMNDIPKHVVTNTLSKVEWKNSILVKGDLVTEVKKLKAQIQRDVLVFGSLKLSSQLLQHVLVDANLLMTTPRGSFNSALLIVSEIGENGRFEDSSSLVGYAGLAPSIHSSGGRTYHGSSSVARGTGCKARRPGA